MTLDFSRPGKPTDNAFIEAFNGRLRAECLNTHWFLTLSDAREKLKCRRRDYNEVRPHGAIGNKPPAALLDCIGVTSPPMSKEPEKSNLRRGGLGACDREAITEAVELLGVDRIDVETTLE